jgi:hypothetical protein
MNKIIYKVVKHESGWAFEVNDGLFRKIPATDLDGLRIR